MNNLLFEKFLQVQPYTKGVNVVEGKCITYTCQSQPQAIQKKQALEDIIKANKLPMFVLHTDRCILRVCPTGNPWLYYVGELHEQSGRESSFIFTDDEYPADTYLYNGFDFDIDGDSGEAKKL